MKPLKVWLFGALLAPFLTAQTVTPIKPTNLVRYQPTLTILADGRVLALGGNGPGLLLYNTGEIFDPATGQWSETGPMTIASSRPQTALLRDGRLLVVSSARGVDQFDIFDPILRTFTSVGQMAGNGTYPMVSFEDGRVLLLGLSVTPHIFDPATNQTIQLDDIEPGRPFRLPDGRLVVVGTDSAVIYTIAGNKLQPQVRHDLRGTSRASMAMLTDGRILMGGTTGYNDYPPNSFPFSITTPTSGRLPAWAPTPITWPDWWRWITGGR